MDDAKTERAVLRSPRDTSYSGYRLRCQRCGPSKLTLAEFREQLSCRPEQIWHCPKCGSVAEFKGSLCAAPLRQLAHYSSHRTNCVKFLFCVVAEAQRRWQKGHCRRHQETLGQGQSRSCHGGQGPTGTRRQESRCEESAGEGCPEGREEGCRQATAESRRDSCCPGGNRVALPKLQPCCTVARTYHSRSMGSLT